MDQGGGSLKAARPEVVVRFTLSRSEYLSTWYRWYAKRHGRLVVLLLLAACVFAIDGLWVVPAFVAWWLAVCVGISPFVLWRRHPQIREEREHGFSEAGTWGRLTHVIRSECEWNYWTGLLEAGKAYVLQAGRRGMSFIPRRAFTSPDEERRFRELAEAGIRSHE